LSYPHRYGPPRTFELVSARAPRLFFEILAEFKGPQGWATTWDELGWKGDLNYHVGGYKSPKEGQKANLVNRMSANPSHLGSIDPFISDMVHATDESMDEPGGRRFKTCLSYQKNRTILIQFVA